MLPSQDVQPLYTPTGILGSVLFYQARNPWVSNTVLGSVTSPLRFPLTSVTVAQKTSVRGGGVPLLRNQG